MPAQKPWYKNPVIMVPAVVVVIGAVIGLIGSISSPLVTEWYKKIYDPEKKTIDIYRVRVTVIDPQKIPVEDASVRSTMSNEAKKIDGGWQIDIPYESKPKDSKLTIFADKKSAYLHGEIVLELKEDPNPSVIIFLEKLENNKTYVRGKVVDDLNRAIKNATISVVGYSEAAITTETGHFELPAHAAIGEKVLLHAEKKGYVVVEEYHEAEGIPVSITLRKK